MKKIIYIIAILFLSVEVQAQEETKQDSIFTQDVNIVREFIPTIQDAGKINTLPSIEKPEPIEDENVKYSTWTSPLPTRFDLQTLPAATLNKMRQIREYREGHAKIGVGNYTSFLGDVYLPVLKGKDYRLDFLFNHLSTFGKVRLDNDEKVKAKNMTNAAQLAFNKNFFKVDLDTEIKFRRRDFNYYGLDSLNAFLSTLLPETPIENYIQPSSDAHNMFDFRLAVNSRPKIGGTNYGVAVDYELTNTKSGLYENLLAINGFISTNWDIDEMGIALSLDNFFYNNPTPVNSFFMAENEFENYSVFGLKPFYTFKRNTWDLKLGLKAFFAIDHGQAVNITPDIHGKIALVDKIFYLYGGITGDYKINSMRTIFDENQYARPDIQPENTYTPFDAYAGLKIKLFDYMVLNGFAGYKYIANQHFFINSRIADAYYGNTFDIINDKTGLFNVGASLTYNYKKSLSLLLKGVYNQWSPKTQEFAWHKPAWELDFNIDYKVIEDLKLTANFFVLGKRKALGFANETVELKPIFDLNLSATYEFASWIAFYVNFNNIFAQNYQLWYGYNSQRFNAMAGAVFSF